MVFHLSKLRQLVLISQGRGIHVGLDTAEVIQGCLAAVLNMALHQGNGALRVLVQQAVQDIQMLQTGVMDLHLVLLAGNDDPGILIKYAVHHINDIAVAAVFDDEQVHGGVQSESVLYIRGLSFELAAEGQQFLAGKVGRCQAYGNGLNLNSCLKNLKHIV